MKRLNKLQVPRRIGIVALAACVAVAGGGALAVSQTAAKPHRLEHATASSGGTSKQARGPAVHDVLYGDGIGRAKFSEAADAAIRRLDLLLDRKPSKPYHPNSMCDVDHESDWPGVNAFFAHGRFVGYAYWAARHRSTVVLATAKGLRIGDRLSKGRRLYGRDFLVSPEQGGSWSAKTSQGKIFGYTSGDPNGPRSTVASIEAGDVGCPATTP